MNPLKNPLQETRNMIGTHGSSDINQLLTGQVIDQQLDAVKKYRSDVIDTTLLREATLAARDAKEGAYKNNLNWAINRLNWLYRQIHRVSESLALFEKDEVYYYWICLQKHLEATNALIEQLEDSGDHISGTNLDPRIGSDDKF